MKYEPPQYIAKVAETSPEVDIMCWWVEHSDKLPHWSAAAKMVAFIWLSSAAVEMVFSILNVSFGTQQDDSQQGGSVIDYIKASVMLQYNSK